MDTSIYLCLLIGFLIIIWVESCVRQKRKRATRLPPGPIAWPIIGNLHHLAGKSPHRDIAKLSARYGPIFTLKMGSRPALVVSSAIWAKEFLHTHDKEFADRPNSAVARGVGLGSLAFKRTGVDWRQMRKIATLELLSPKKMEACQELRIQGIRKGMAEIASRKGEAVGIRQATGEIVGGIMSKILFSTSLLKQGMELKRLVDEVNEASGGLIVSDFLPWLGLLQIRAKSGLARFVAARDSLMSEMFALRRSQYKKLQPECLLDLLLDLQQQGDCLPDNRDQPLYGFLMGLFVAAIDTTSSTVEWAMAKLMRHPKILKKVKEEMDREVVRLERNVGDILEDKEVGKLRYLHGVVNETLRLHPPLPFLLPRESLAQCVVGEGQYEIPKGTLIYINVWEIGRDPIIWEKPHEFIPERFYIDDNKLEDSLQQQQNEHILLAFGGGRRGCPGKALGHSTAKIVLANLLYGFDWKTKNDNAQLLDMDENLGLAQLKKKIPLVAIPTPQHSALLSNQK